MQIKMKLFASLRDCLPDPNNSIVDLEVEPEVTPLDLIERYNIPREKVHLLMINGVYVAPEGFADASLNEGDVVAMWPPIAGG